jgi:hypothetical protein
MLKMSPVKYQSIPLVGGYDIATTSLLLRPGAFRNGQNFEIATNGGYSRIAGYERYDGQARPSDAQYKIVQVTSFTNTPSTNQTITQATSAATGVIVYVGSNFMVVTKVTGFFDETHQITTPGPVIVGTATTQTVAPTSVENSQYLNLAADEYRDDIQPVPGSGAVLGVVGAVFSGVDNVYAFRANVGGTAVDMYKSSASGWVQVTFYNEVVFTAGGTATPADGAVLTQGGVTATVRRVVTRSGVWTGTAAGAFIITNPVGGNFAAGAATLTGGATVTLSGIQTAITLATGGKFEFVSGNFSGQLGTLRIYGCDGVNRAFEFDGTTLVPIATGASPDAPKHIAVHKNYLFVSIQSSIFYSGVGTPFRWGAVDGGGEIATGDTVSNMLVLPGNQNTATLVVTGQGSTSMLYGTSAATWNFVTYNSGVGARDYSAQNMADTYIFDDRGVFSVQTTLNFGNFASACLTQNIKAFIAEKRTKVSYSTVSREKNQYRVFFNDGYGLYLTIVNGKFMGSAPVFFDHPVYCAWEGETFAGAEVSYFGAADAGYVHQLDVGSSFDGNNIEAFVTLAYDFAGSPRLLKQWRHASLEMQSNYYAALSFGYNFGYSSPEYDQPGTVSYESSFSGAVPWDVFTWDAFVWDGVTLAPTEIDIAGTAENIQATISSTTDYIFPFTINSIIYHYTPRRGLR